MSDQADLSSWGAVPEADEEDETPGGNAARNGVRKDVIAYKLMPENAEPDNRFSCPWCCAPPSDFRHHDDGKVGCGYCDAVIPVDAEWYQSGEKIVI